jgi:hypothetical protein
MRLMVSQKVSAPKSTSTRTVPFAVAKLSGGFCFF